MENNILVGMQIFAEGVVGHSSHFILWTNVYSTYRNVSQKGFNNWQQQLVKPVLTPNSSPIASVFNEGDTPKASF